MSYDDSSIGEPTNENTGVYLSLVSFCTVIAIGFIYHLAQ